MRVKPPSIIGSCYIWHDDSPDDYDWFARLIVAFQRLHPGDYDWIPLKQDELLACIPEKHPLAKRKTFPVKAFATDDFIELYPGKETDNSQMLQRNGIKPHVKYSTSDNYAAYAMVAAGLGITCTNAIIGESFKEGVRYLPLSPRQLVEIGIATPKKQELSPAAKRFAEFAREQFAQKQE